MTNQGEETMKLLGEYNEKDKEVDEEIVVEVNDDISEVHCRAMNMSASRF